MYKIIHTWNSANNHKAMAPSASVGLLQKRKTATQSPSPTPTLSPALNPTRLSGGQKPKCQPCYRQISFSWDITVQYYCFFIFT